MSYLAYNRMHTSGWICTMQMSKTEKEGSDRPEAVYPNICKKNVAYLNLGKMSPSTWEGFSVLEKNEEDKSL